jgi:hypothetical protein
LDFSIKIDTPPNLYTESNPLKTILKLTRGRCIGGWIYFPTGPAGLLHVKINLGIHQIAPSNDDSNYSLNDCVVPLHLDFLLDVPPFEFHILTWNESIYYIHTCTVTVFLDPWADVGKRKSWLTRIFKHD